MALKDELSILSLLKTGGFVGPGGLELRPALAPDILPAFTENRMIVRTKCQPW
jgi:hypothetical protein